MSGPAAGLFELWSWGVHWGPLGNFRSICRDFPPRNVRLRTKHRGRRSLSSLAVFWSLGSFKTKSCERSPQCCKYWRGGKEDPDSGGCWLIIRMPGHLLMVQDRSAQGNLDSMNRWIIQIKPECKREKGKSNQILSKHRAFSIDLMLLENF